MDRILLHGIRCRMCVGVTAEERSTPQDCLIDIEIGCDLRRAMRSDDVGDTLDYGRLHALVVGLTRRETFSLLEGFAGRLEEEILEVFEFENLTIRIKKLNPPLEGSLDFAGIEIRR